ncbi:MAG: helix-turn-helix domain-containing protein [Candidatus Undinarchaeales archaeon]|jgi:predicted transcriptional regulator|nr:helix-turn-helix domain-containing protein [Candidatus Undinarchaeales archaeon]
MRCRPRPIATFACRSVSFKGIVTCGFELSRTEYTVMMHLLSDAEELTASEIAKDLAKDRTTVQRAVMSLTGKNILRRRQSNNPRGGYTFFYSIKDKDQLKQRILDIIEQWTAEIRREMTAW